jgi:hypothetical protein
MKVILDFLVYSYHVNIESGHIIDHGDLCNIIDFWEKFTLSPEILGVFKF